MTSLRFGARSSRCFDLTKEQERPDGVEYGSCLTPEALLRFLIAICPTMLAIEAIAT